MLNYLFYLLTSLTFVNSVSLQAEEYFDFDRIERLLKSNANPKILTKKIEFENFSTAYNPSIHKTDQGIILSFRYHPDGTATSQCGVVLLDEFFNPVFQPQIISFRETDLFPAYFMDCRIISFNGKIYALYTDFSDFDYSPSMNFNPFSEESLCKEYVHLAEIELINNEFKVGPSLKLIYPEKRNNQIREKNWIPFEWNGKLYLSYYLFPHEILEPNLITGECKQFYLTDSYHPWKLGQIRGTTPPMLVEGIAKLPFKRFLRNRNETVEYPAFFHSSKGIAKLPFRRFLRNRDQTEDSEYLAFFHSSIKCKSNQTQQISLYYFIGAYTFSFKPPFEITKASAKPIIAEGMYTDPDKYLHAIFPCGYYISGDDIYLSYGKDDCEMWIAKIPKQEVLDTLVRVRTK